MIRRKSECRVEKREAMRGGPGTVNVSHYFDRAEFGAKVRLCARLILPPGSGIGTHRHEDEDEVYLVLVGKGVLDDGRERQVVQAGDAVLTRSGESHSILNDGEEDLEIAAFIACYNGRAE